MAGDLSKMQNLFLPLRSVKRAKCGELTKIDVFSKSDAEEEQKIRNFAITESRNDRFPHLVLQKTLRYAEMVRITERKRFGQRLQLITCLRESRKNANIGDQFSHLTRTKTFKNDEIVISPIRKTPRPSRPLSNLLNLLLTMRPSMRIESS